MNRMSRHQNRSQPIGFPLSRPYAIPAGMEFAEEGA